MMAEVTFSATVPHTQEGPTKGVTVFNAVFLKMCISDQSRRLQANGGELHKWHVKEDRGGREGLPSAPGRGKTNPQ